MKIEYRTTLGSGAFTILADESDLSKGSVLPRIRDYQPVMRKRPLVARLFLGVNPLVKDMGNATWSLRFTVERMHADPDAAATWISTEAAALGGVVGTFDLQITFRAGVFLAGNCALDEFTPAAASDKSSVITYVWTPQSYATLQQAADTD